VIGVVIATLLAVTYGTFTYRGGGITPHAGDQTGDAPGAADPVIPLAKGERRTAGPFQLTAPNSQPRGPGHTLSPPSTQGEAHGRSSPLR
jgi:hypothetical protein